MRLIPHDYIWREVPDHRAQVDAYVAGYAARIALAWRPDRDLQAPLPNRNPHAPDMARPREWRAYVSWLRGWQAASRAEARRLAQHSWDGEVQSA